MTIANDTFVEASDTALTSHTPTGTNAGTSWQTSQAGAAGTVRAATDDVRDNNTSSGNRHQMSDDLGDANMDVQADINYSGFASGDLLFVGVSGRHPSPAGLAAYEFVYDGSKWALDDANGQASLTETNPLPRTIRLEVRTAAKTGYVLESGLWVQKVQRTTDLSTGNTRGGIILGNFTSNTGKRSLVDNYQSVSAFDLATKQVNLPGFRETPGVLMISGGK